MPREVPLSTPGEILAEPLASTPARFTADLRGIEGETLLPYA